MGCHDILYRQTCSPLDEFFLSAGDALTCPEHVCILMLALIFQDNENQRVLEVEEDRIIALETAISLVS